MRIQVGCFLVLSVAWQVNGLVRNANQFRPLLARPESSDNIEEIYIEQPIDHFDESNSDSGSDESSWLQRAWSNNEFYEYTDAPIFLMIGSEGTSDESDLKKGAMYDLAKKYKAMMYMLEHRYYGSSLPFKELSTENMKYLTSDQALGDIISFINQESVEKKYTDENKWILFGGRFAGNLVAWARTDNSNFVTGAVASSPPLEAKADFSDYNKVMKESLNTLYPGCGDAVTDASTKILEMFRADGTDEVLKTFNTCSDGFDHKDELDIAAFFDNIAENIRDAVEDNDDDDADLKIKDVCEKYMLNATIGTPLQRLAALQKDEVSECSPVNYQIVTDYLQSSESIDNGEWQWKYQTCSELGYFKTSASKDSLFSDSIPLRYFTEQCVDLFGDKFNQNALLDEVDSLNEFRKGTKIVTTNVVFVQGSIDPWHPLGMVEKATENDPLLFINGTSNTADMNAARSTDSPALKAARDKIDSKIKEWLDA